MLRKIYDHRFYPLILVFVYLCLLGVDVYVLDHKSKGQITEILKTWVPWGLRINFLLILTAILICFRDLAALTKGFINRKGCFWRLFSVWPFHSLFLSPQRPIGFLR